MRKTKIIATIGPSVKNEIILSDMINAGVDVIRINLSHGNRDEWKNYVKITKKARIISGKNIPIIIDNKGPEIRITHIENNKTIPIKKDEIYEFEYNREKYTKNNKIYVDFEHINNLKIGQEILIDDGKIKMIVIENEKKLKAKAINNGILKSRKALNIPLTVLDIDSFSKEDLENIEFMLKLDIDFLAMSFVRSKFDILKAREILEKNDAQDVRIIAKIENQEGIDNIEEIIELSDAVMIARGDLGVETPIYEVSSVQERIIKIAKSKCKTVIVATHMLDSMCVNPIPTRAEVSDVYNAVKSQVSATMLSAETASGEYPVESVKMMKEIIINAEKEDNIELILKTSDSVAKSISFVSINASKLVNSKVILVYTETGRTARFVSAFRPKIPVFGVTPNKKTQRQLNIEYAVRPILEEKIMTIEEMFDRAIEVVKTKIDIKPNDNITVLAGRTVGVPGSTNTMRIIRYDP